MEDTEVGIIVGVVREGYIEVGVFFMERVVVCAVHTKCKHTRFVSEKPRRAVALMYVEVYDYDLRGAPVIEQMLCRYGNVIQEAKTLTVFVKSMVRTACHIHRYAVFERVMCASNRAARYQYFALGKGCRLWEANTPFFFGGKGKVLDALVVGRVVDAEYCLVGSRDGVKEVFGGNCAFVK